MSNNQINCTTGTNAAGSYPLYVQVFSNGFSNKKIIFTYNLAINSISSVSGSYGGGLEVTLSGDGFNDSNTLVSICNKKCEISRKPNSTTVTFKVSFLYCNDLISSINFL